MARQAFASLQIRSLSLPGADPLHLMLNECKRRNLCDESGYRLPGVHWTFSVSVGSDDPMKVKLNEKIDCIDRGLVGCHT
jgi:hypothetical protein